MVCRFAFVATALSRGPFRFEFWENRQSDAKRLLRTRAGALGLNGGTTKAEKAALSPPPQCALVASEAPGFT